MKILKLLFILMTAFAVIGQIENWRGRARWASARDTLLAHGYSLDWRDYYPPPPPASENASFHPAFAKLYRSREDGTKIVDFTPYYTQLETVPTERPPGQGDAEFLEATAAMGELAAIWEEAFSRPHCVWFPFDVRATDGFPPIPTVGNVTSMANGYAPLYRQRALARLRLRDPESARREWLASLDFFNCFAEEPSLVGLLVNIALMGIVLPGCEEVIAAEGWREKDLAQFQEIFGAMKFLDRVDAAMHLVLVADLHMMEALMHGEEWALELAEQWSYKRWMRHMPRGWWYQNFATTVDHMQANAFDWYDRDRGILKQGDPDAMPTEEDREQNRRHPYRCIAQIVVPTIGNMLGFAADNESRAKLLELACALRRYQLEKGSFPQSLTSLVPAFIDEVPVDSSTGITVDYQQTDVGIEVRSMDKVVRFPGVIQAKNR